MPSKYFWTLYRILAVFVGLEIGGRITHLWFWHTYLPFTHISWRRTMQFTRRVLEYPHDFGCRFQGYKDAVARVSYGNPKVQRQLDRAAR